MYYRVAWYFYVSYLLAAQVGSFQKGSLIGALIRMTKGVLLRGFRVSYLSSFQGGLKGSLLGLYRGSTGFSQPKETKRYVRYCED